MVKKTPGIMKPEVSHHIANQTVSVPKSQAHMMKDLASTLTVKNCNDLT